MIRDYWWLPLVPFLALAIIPFVQASEPQPEIQLPIADVNAAISKAASIVFVEPPAWEIALRDELTESPEYADRVADAIKFAADQTGLEPGMIWSVMYTESRGRHTNNYGRVKHGGAGEIGAMQVLPFWERSLKREYDLDIDLYKLEDNILAGATILTRGGDEARVMLSYYNTGKRVRNTKYQRKVMRYWESFE